MTYELLYTETFLRQLKKLSRDVQKRIVQTLERCRILPYHFVKKLVGCPYFRLRTGDYRIIIDIQQGKMQIMVLEVGHRKNIYD